MGIFSIILLAAALAMDAFSVAVTDGMIVRSIRARDALKIGIFFGVFQFVMPFLGSVVSGFAIDYIRDFDHWLAFGLLTFLGVRMIIESRREKEIPKNPLKTSTLFLMAVATSIDALAAGVTLAAADAPILFACTVIGVTAFLFSVCGVFLGRRFGDLLGSKAEIAGGIVLILIGTKILVEHLI